MEVIKANPCGYCKGVLQAIKIARQTRAQYPDTPIHILGMLVHNRYVSFALDQLNIISLSEKGKTRMELLDQIDEGIVIFSAHGVSNEVYKKAKAKGLTVVDATCVDVLKTKKLIQDVLKEERQVIYIGVKNHPEAEGCVNDDPVNIHLVTSIEDVVNLPLNLKQPFITNQTTMNVSEIQSIIEAILKRYPDAECCEEICFATRSRQEAVKKMENLDILYVVGDPHSNNTRNLAKCAAASVKKVRCVETIEDLDLSELNENSVVGITAGASTPTSLTNQIIEFLKNYRTGTELPKVTSEIL